MARQRKTDGSGHLTIVEKEERRQAEEIAKQGVELLSKRPRWLINRDALDEWNVIATELRSNPNLVGNIDVTNLVAYCNAVAHYKEVSKQLSDPKNDLIETENGPRENPCIMILKKWSEEMTRCANRAGISASARLSQADRRIKEKAEEAAEAFGI